MIKSIEIKNFMSIKQKLFHIKKLTLLYGNNSSGKTNLIRNLLITRQSFKSGMDRALNGDYIQLDKSGSVYMWSNKNSWQSYYKFESRKELDTKLLYKGGKYTFLARVRKQDGNMYDELRFLENEEPLFGSRFFHVSPKDMYNEPYHLIKDRFERLRDADLLVFNDMSLFNSYFNKDEFWGVLFSSVAFLKRSGYYFEALLTAQPGDLIILEHPENFLHPKMQSFVGRMASVLASKGVQIIIESHSDHIINSVLVAHKQKVIDRHDAILYNFVMTQKDGEYYSKVETGEITEDSGLHGELTGFCDQWEKDLSFLMGF